MNEILLFSFSEKSYYLCLTQFSNFYRHHKYFDPNTGTTTILILIKSYYDNILLHACSYMHKPLYPLAYFYAGMRFTVIVNIGLQSKLIKFLLLALKR